MPRPPLLIDDLDRFLEGRPILARRISPAELAWRWCQRNPWLAGALGSAALALAAVAVLSLLYAAEQGRCAAKDRRPGREPASVARAVEPAGRRARDVAERIATARGGSLSRARAVGLRERGYRHRHGLDGRELRAAAQAGDTAWQHAARTNLAAWQSQYPALMGVFPHTGAVRRCRVQSRRRARSLRRATTARRGCGTSRTAQPKGAPLIHQKSITSRGFQSRRHDRRHRKLGQDGAALGGGHRQTARAAARASSDGPGRRVQPRRQDRHQRE